MLRAIKCQSRPIRFSGNAAHNQRTKRMWPLAVSVTAGPPNNNISNWLLPVEVTTSSQGQEVPIEENGKGRNNTQVRHEETRGTRASLSELDWSHEEGEARVTTRVAAVNASGGEAKSSSKPKHSLRSRQKSTAQRGGKQESISQRSPPYPPTAHGSHQSSRLSHSQQQLASLQLPVFQPPPHTSNGPPSFIPAYTDDQWVSAPWLVPHVSVPCKECLRELELSHQLNTSNYSPFSQQFPSFQPAPGLQQFPSLQPPHGFQQYSSFQPAPGSDQFSSFQPPPGFHQMARPQPPPGFHQFSNLQPPPGFHQFSNLQPPPGFHQFSNLQPPPAAPSTSRQSSTSQRQPWV